MKGKLFFIIAILCSYTFFKVTQTVPNAPLGSALFTVALFGLMISWVLLYHAKPELVDDHKLLLFIWMGSLTMGFWTTFMMLSIPIDLVFLIHYLLSTVFKTYSYNTQDMIILSQKINYVLLVMSACLAFWGLFAALRAPRVKEVTVPIINLPLELNNLIIAQISDLHIGPTIREGFVQKVVNRTNATNPDIIVITGDLADAKADAISKHLQPLAELKSRFGVYYVTGNHEYYWGIQTWIDTVKNLGFIPLINENQIIDMNGISLLIAGITDHIGGQFLKEHHPDISKAAVSEQKSAFKILLAHRPDVYIVAEKLGFDLQLSGHTHAGQFFPFNLLLPMVYKYYRRLNKHGALWLYVNPGTGYWGPANRVGVPPEITLLQLKTD
ncbi:MAG: metallophosphoesterase [Legionella sp.]|nr:metallophosphoesterase [Legionella sp.]